MNSPSTRELLVNNREPKTEPKWEGSETDPKRVPGYLGCRIQVSMDPWIPVMWNPSQYGSANICDMQSKLVWVREYLWCGIRVRMGPQIPVTRNPSQYGSTNTWDAKSKSVWIREYLWRGIQVSMDPRIPGMRNPSQYGSANTCDAEYNQYGSANTCDAESKSLWVREYLECGIQVSMDPRIPGMRNPIQYGSTNTWDAKSKSVWVRNTWDAKSKSVWIREYLGCGIQVNMDPWSTFNLFGSFLKTV